MTALPQPILPFIRDEFALDYTRSGLLLSAFSLATGLGQLPGGWLADRIGRRLLVSVGIVGVALVGILVGLSSTYMMMIFFLVLMGLASGGYHPSAPPMLSASVGPTDRGKALGFHMIGGSASFFLVPLIAAAISAAWGWRASFIVLAIPAIVFGLVLYLLLGWRPVVVKAAAKPDGSNIEMTPAPSNMRRLIAFIVLTTFTAALGFSTISFLPLFMVDNFGISREAAAASLSLIFSAGFWAGPLGGYVSDRWGQVPLVLAMCFLGGPVIYLLNVLPYGLGFGALLITMGMTAYVRMPASEAYLVDNTSERRRSTVLGVYYFGTMEGSGVTTPIVGYLIDHFGFYTSFTAVSAATVAVTLACALFLRGGKD